MDKIDNYDATRGTSYECRLKEMLRKQAEMVSDEQCSRVLTPVLKMIGERTFGKPERQRKLVTRPPAAVAVLITPGRTYVTGQGTAVLREKLTMDAIREAPPQPVDKPSPEGFK